MNAQTIAEQNNQRADHQSDADDLVDVILAQRRTINDALKHLQTGISLDIAKAIEILKGVQG